MLEFATNSLVQESIGKTPNELVFGVPLQSVVDHLDDLHLVQGPQDMVRAINYISDSAYTKMN